jgi:hypothetical protein
MKQLYQVHAIPETKSIIAPREIGKYIEALTKRGQQWFFQKYLDGVLVPNPYYIYFTSNEEIKVGEGPLWCLNKNGDTVYQIIQAIGGESEFWNKIVATNNPNLLPRYTGRDEEDDTYTCLTCGQEGIERNARATEFTPCKCVSASIDKSFIEAFVKANGNIKEVELEVNEYIPDYGEIDSNTLNPDRLDYRGYETIKTLKLNPDGSVIWSLPKTKINSNLSIDDAYHLTWIFNRLMSVHQENPDVDYMVKFRGIIDKLITLTYTGNKK